MILSIDNISVSYGATKVLHNFSLRAKQGQVVAIVGRNGCSKTTLLKAIIGDVALQQGQITLVASRSNVEAYKSQICSND